MYKIDKKGGGRWSKNRSLGIYLITKIIILDKKPFVPDIKLSKAFLKYDKFL